MQQYIKYISLIITVLVFISCSLKEDLEPVDMRQDKYIEFIVRPTSFLSHNVSEASTKATLTETELTALEKKVVNAFYVIFKPNGERYGSVQEFSNISDNAIPSHKVRTDVNSSDITVCVIANVPPSIAKSIDHIDDLGTAIPLTYATYSETGYYGIPKMDIKDTPSNPNDDVACFPMCGMYHGPLAGENNQIQVPLKRLFAKVNATFSMDMGTNLLEGVLGGTLNDYIGDILGGLQIGNTAENARFEMNGYSLHNLPTQVRLAEYPRTEDGSQPTVESAWVKESGKFENHLNMTLTDPIIYDKSNPSETVKKTFSFSFYTPEYALLPNATAVDTYDGYDNPERYKAVLFDNTQKHPLSMTIEGRLHDHGGTYADVKYNVYFGENNFDSFSLFRNNQYNNTLTIKGAGHLSKGETIDNRVDVLPLNLVDAYDQAANCYIISIPGTYELDTYKGVIKNITASSPKVSGSPIEVWNASTNTITFDTEKSNDGQIVFTVGNSTGNIQPGNAVIAAQTASGIQWSWHLWFCEPDSRPDNNDYQHNYPTSGAKVMNRALGATTAIGDGVLAPLKALGYDIAIWSDGLYYQWGRKDPLVLGSDNKIAKTASSATYANSIKNPDTFYTDWRGEYTNETVGWTDTKSTNDPCPPGYKVPAYTIWRDVNNSTGMEDLFSRVPNLGYPYNLNASIDVSHNVVYPYSSFVSTNGTLSPEKSDSRDVLVEGYDYTTTLTHKKYTDVVVHLKFDVVDGAIWSNRINTSAHFDYSTLNLTELSSISIKSAKCVDGVQTGGNWWNPEYSYDGTPYDVSNSDIDRAARGVMEAAILIRMRNGLTQTLFDRDYAGHTSATGLHVRCVRDE